MSLTLEGKRVVVTGGGTGIGRGIALRCARAGAAVAVTGRREDPLKETVELVREVAGNVGERAVHATMDVRDDTRVDAAVRSIVESFGGIDVLVNNAGAGGPNACAADGPDTWEQILRTNLDGVYFCSRAVLPHMPDGGSIVNISSVLGKFGVPGYTAYCASKHGVIGFTKALALEVADRNVTVNAICPGWVETQMARDGMQRMAESMKVSYDEARRQALSMVPLGRILEPEEIGDMVVYLASDAASGVTAQAFSICGGQVMSG